MTHFRKLFNPDYLGAYALDPGQELTLTIAKVQTESVIGADGKKDDCMVCYFREDVKPMILNATNAKAIARLYKTPYIEEWIGKQIIVRSQQVKAFGDVVDALRIKPQIPVKEPEFKCGDCKKTLTGYGNMSAKQLADYTRKTYGKVLCSECARKIADAKKAAEAEAKAKAAEVSTKAEEAGTTEAKGPGATAADSVSGTEHLKEKMKEDA